MHLRHRIVWNVLDAHNSPDHIQQPPQNVRKTKISLVYTQGKELTKMYSWRITLQIVT